MKIKTAKLTGGSVLINGSLSLPDTNTGHVKDAYSEWLSEGNVPEPMDVIDPWPQIRSERDSKINAMQFEYDRNARELRLNATSTRSIKWMATLDQYVQDLADIPQTFKDNPDGVVFPQLPA